MRKILTLAVIATFGLAAFSGCKKSNSTSYTMTVTVNDTAISWGDTYTLGTGTPLTVFSYNGVSSGLTPPYMQINMHNFTGVGTYNFDTVLTSNYAVYVTATSGKISASGAVVITASSAASVSGTFSFITTDGTVVSNGKFTAKRE